MPTPPSPALSSSASSRGHRARGWETKRVPSGSQPIHPILWKTHHTAPNPAPGAKGRTPTAAIVLIFQGISWPIPNSRVVGRSAAPHCHLLSLPLPQHPKFRVERVPAGAELLTTRAGPRATALQRGLDFLINERRTPRDERVPWGHLSCSITPCSAAMGENTQEGFGVRKGREGSLSHRCHGHSRVRVGK